MVSRSLMFMKHEAPSNVATLRQTRGTQMGLLQCQITSPNVRVQMIFPIAFFVKRPEQSPVRFSKRAGFEASGVNRRVHPRIIARLTNINNQLTRTQFGVLVAHNMMKLQVPS